MSQEDIAARPRWACNLFIQHRRSVGPLPEESSRKIRLIIPDQESDVGIRMWSSVLPMLSQTETKITSTPRIQTQRHGVLDPVQKGLAGKSRFQFDSEEADRMI